MITKPMLAPNDEFNPEQCALPKLASAKIDGFRMFNEGGECYTRSGKPMANAYTQEFFSRREFDGLDGELVVGSPSDPDVFNNSQGPLRRKDGNPGAVWYIFDDRTYPELPFRERLAMAMSRVLFIRQNMPDYAHFIEVAQHQVVNSIDEVEAFEEAAVTQGYEGIMLRDPAAAHKAGRATYKENTFLKVKRMVHDEAVIVGYEEQMINDNEAFQDELGRTKRQSLKENLRPSGMVGAFWLKSDKWKEEFKVSASSLTHEQKREAFIYFEAIYKGRIGAFKYFGHGTINAPRQGVFKGVRSDLDLS